MIFSGGSALATSLDARDPEPEIVSFKTDVAVDTLAVCKQIYRVLCK